MAILSGLPLLNPDRIYFKTSKYGYGAVAVNSVPFSKTIRIIGSRFDDALWPSLKYLSGTYKRLNFLVAPRIDFLFFSSNLQCRQASVLPLNPGDHFPVRAHVEI